MIKFYAGLLFLLLVSFPGLALAQNTGSLTGNIKDAAGAMIPNATVALISPSVGTKQTVHTNAHGEYVFPAVPIGTYSLTVHAPSFAEYTQTGLSIDAAQNTRVDVSLQLESVSAQVTVESTGSAVDTQSGTVGTLIDRSLIDNLPIDGNNIVALTAILPGVVDVNAPTTFTQPDSGPTYSANGSRANQNLMLLDGSMWNNVFYNTGLNYPPPPALAEVSVLLNNYKAEYGRNAGSVFNVLTRTGTNSIHGTLWEYLQNSAFNASDYITMQNPKLVQNQFGATIGGPILKDRLHFFFSWQDLRAAQTATSVSDTLTPHERGFTDATGKTALPCDPTGAFPGMTCANFQEAAALAGTSANSYIRNPMYRAPGPSTTQLNAAGLGDCITLLNGVLTKYGTAGRYMPKAEVPSQCFNPVSYGILQKYVPYPNLPNVSPTHNVSTAKLPQNDQDFFFRVDWILPHHTVDARYYRRNADDSRSNAAAGGTGIATYEVDKNTGELNFGNIGDTWVITPNLLNIFRAGYKRYAYYVLPTDPTTAQNLGMNINLPAQSLPTISVYNRFTLGSSSSAYLHSVNENLEIDDAVSWTHKSHNFKAGVSWLRLQYLSINDSPGSFTFYNQGYAYPAADFLSGLLNSETVGNRTTIASTSPNLYLYAQDDWRANSKLTLNYGLRYELPFMWKQPDQQAATFIPGYQSIRFPGAPVDLAYVGDPGVRSSLIPTPKTGFAPRFGFALDVFGTGRTNVKGGIGLFFDAINASVVGVSSPFHYSAQYTPVTGGISQPLLGYPSVPDNFDPKNPRFVGPYSIAYPDADFTTPYTEAGNIGITQKVGRGYLEADYLFKLGRHQLIPVDQNPAILDCSGAAFQANPKLYCYASNPAYIGGIAGGTAGTGNYAARVRYPGFNYGGGGVVDLTTEGTSNYNALQIIGAMRGRGWLSFQSSYTYSRSLDLLSNGQSLGSSVPQISNINTQYGPSDFNATHIFNMGWVVRVPRIRTKRAVVRDSLNDWQFTGLFSARTGHPFNVTTADDVALTKEGGQRAFPVPGANPNLPSNRHRADKRIQWFNTKAFCGDPKGVGSNLEPGTPGSYSYCPTVQYGQFSPIGRNSLIGPAYISTNFGIGRAFNIPYREMHLQFRADAFNVFNTPNLANPNAKFSATSNQFGEVLSTEGTNGNVNTNGRRVQLSLVLRY